MNILIVEDEPPIASYIERQCRKILGNKLESVKLVYNLVRAMDFLTDHEIDLCLLDLNLNGKNGFDLLRQAVSGSFATIVISANTDLAINAFEYGVLDFVPKPFTEQRLKGAFDRYFMVNEKHEIYTKYIPYRKNGEVALLDLEHIRFFKAAGIYVEAYLKSGGLELLDKKMDQLESILPHRFIRTHRSCIISIPEIKSYGHVGGGIYRILTHTDESLPLSRSKYRELQRNIDS